MAAEFFLQKGSPTYIHPENADVISISQFMAQNLRQPPPIPQPPKHTFEIAEGESVEIEKIVAAEKKDGQMYYKVKWVKYTWEAEESIQHLPHLIDGYWRDHFYQNINQAAIDTTGINLVSAEAAAEFVRNKAVTTAIVNSDTQEDVKGTVTLIPDKIASPDETAQQVINDASIGATVATAQQGDVILEFTMPPKDALLQSRVLAGSTTESEEKKTRRTTSLERKYVCQVCSKAFDRNTSLTRHMLTHTREKPFKCQLCDKSFSQNAHLKRHILIHIGQKSYQCNKCGKMFIEKGGLARHEATHSTEKPWVCNQCGKAFVLNEYLQRHLFLHTGQKPYQCNQCGRLFADGSSWRAHKLTHNKEKKFKCHICNKLLKCKRNFRKHVLAHDEEKDPKHECMICYERFPNKKTLKAHIKLGRRAHKCEICHFYPTNRESYSSHMATHDPNSETYDPNPKIYESMSEEIMLEEMEASQMDIENISNSVLDNEIDADKSDNESTEENAEDEETLSNILDGGSSSQQSLQEEGEIIDSDNVPPSFTTLILKPENIAHAVTNEERQESMVTAPAVISLATGPTTITLSAEQLQAINNANATTDPSKLNMIQENLQSVINSVVSQQNQDMAMAQQSVPLPVVMGVTGGTIIEGVNPQLDLVETNHASAVNVIDAFSSTIGITTSAKSQPPLPAQVISSLTQITPTMLSITTNDVENTIAPKDSPLAIANDTNSAGTIIRITQNDKPNLNC